MRTRPQLESPDFRERPSIPNSGESGYWFGTGKSWGATGSASASQAPIPFELTLAKPVAHNTKIKH
jgi:hypothetical protein